MSSTPTTTPPATEPVVATDEALTPNLFETRIDRLIENITNLAATLKTWQKDAKEMKKDYIKEKKILMKNSKKKTPQSPDAKKNSGFCKPVALSDHLKTFLKLESDTMLSRTDITKLVTAYIRENDLLKTDNKRVIDVWANTPAAKDIKNLLSPKAGDEITWFNLQTYLKSHYPKATEVPENQPAPVAKVVSAAEPVQVTKSPAVKRVRTARVRAAAH